jgi:hypothetical protein
MRSGTNMMACTLRLIRIARIVNIDVLDDMLKCVKGSRTLVVQK